MVSFRTLFSAPDGGRDDRNARDDFRESLLPRSRVHRDVHSAVEPKKYVCLIVSLVARLAVC